MTEQFRGKITKFYKGCPKPDGWFGCFFQTMDKQEIQCTGKYLGPLVVGMMFDIIVEPSGKQYEIQQMFPVLQSDSSVIKYLSSKYFPGIGQAKAEKIYNKFKSRTFDVILSRSDELKSVEGLSEKNIDTLYYGLVSLDVDNQIKRLCPMFSDKLVDKIICVYSERAVKVLTTNPYDLLYTMDGLSFDTVDEAALHMGIQKLDKYRIRQCFRYAVHTLTANNGHVYWNVSDGPAYADLLNQAFAYIKDPTVSADMLAVWVQDIRNVKGLTIETTNTGSRVYETEYYKTECKVAELIRKLLARPSVFSDKSIINGYINDYEEKTGWTLDSEQRQAVHMALTNRFSIITGGPGCGKTSVVSCILYVWEHVCPSKLPVLSAPTGKACRRLQEATHYKVETVARRVIRSENNKISTKVAEKDKELYKSNLVLVDEVSMIGLADAKKMLELFQDSQIVLIGDVDQLPSISQGQFFKDICNNSNIPKTVLLHNHRVAGERVIVDNAKRINNGDINLDETDMSFQFVKTDDGLDYSDILVSDYLKFIKNENDIINKDKIQDVCILCPTKKNTTGTYALNIKIQDIVNPVNPTAGLDENGYEILDSYYGLSKNNFTRLRVGDRVIQTKNRNDAEYIMIDSNGKKQTEKGISNGDCGFIIKYQQSGDEESFLLFQTDDGRVYRIDSLYFDELELAYAMTVHKSQGSEYDTVLFSAQPLLKNNLFFGKNFSYSPLSKSTFATRNLLYTAVTRAKKQVRMIGCADGIKNCILTRQLERNSALNERINGCHYVVTEGCDSDTVNITVPENIASGIVTTKPKEVMYRNEQGFQVSPDDIEIFEDYRLVDMWDNHAKDYATFRFAPTEDTRYRRGRWYYENDTYDDILVWNWSKHCSECDLQIGYRYNIRAYYRKTKGGDYMLKMLGAGAYWNKRCDDFVAERLTEI